MKTQEQDLDSINRELIESTLDYLRGRHDTILHEIQNEHTYNLDENGFLTKEALQRIRELEQEERDTLKNIRQLQFQLEVYITDRNTPAYNIDNEIDDFDLVNTLDQIEKEQLEYQQEKALREIQEAREHGLSTGKSHELTR